MNLKKAILDKLSTVIDPELNINIVDMGLIYRIEVKKKVKGKMQKVLIKMTFTTPACPLINDILNDIKNKLDEFADLDIEITVVFDPPWTSDKLSKAAKIKLGMI
jgi:metal-sulfur cluster biosynthetic enzyme